mgnify:CR=1 FL=1
MKEALETLNQRPYPESVKDDQIPAAASEYIVAIEPYITKVEEFTVACVESDWTPGTPMGLRFAGDWISLGERLEERHVRFAQGVPALLAWRLLILMGAQAVADDALSSLSIILREPIEVERLGDRFSYLPLPQRRSLFHPETFLGHAAHAIRYVVDLWTNHPHLHPSRG